jgi:hypothetical protein
MLFARLIKDIMHDYISLYISYLIYRKVVELRE